MTVGLFVLQWFDGVPANVIANVIALGFGVAATRLWQRFSNRRLWSLDDPATVVFFVAEDSRELVPQVAYVRPSTGVGQVRALATLAPSLRNAYRNVDFRRVVMSSEGVGRDLTRDVISLGGAKNNHVRKLAADTRPVPAPDSSST